MTGISPAVRTETVWALAKEDPPVVPHRVVVITTTSGQQAIQRELRTKPDDQTQDMWQELRLAILGPEGEMQASAKNLRT